MTRAYGLLLVLLTASCQSSPRAVEPPSNTAPPHAQHEATFSINGHHFQPEIAIDDDARARGLQHRTAPANGLMLIFPETARHSLWMPNCPEDLEAWVISDTGVLLEVLYLPADRGREPHEATWQYHARLPRHRPAHAARILWEFSAGTAVQMGIQAGDQVDGSWNDVLVGTAYRRNDRIQSR